MLLNGKVALVTGGTGGLGTAVVATLAEAGALVDVPFRDAESFERLRQELATPERISGAALELTDEAAVNVYVEALAAQHGKIDILVNVAGAFAGGKPVHETPWSVWQQQLDINLKTAVLVSQATVPYMLAHGGSIINVSSRTATQSAAKLAAYAASKRAVLQLTEAMAAELREFDITVNAVLPSVIDTPTNRQGRPNADYSHWVKPQDIAKVILFLAGPDARIISGASIPVYGRA